MTDYLLTAQSAVTWAQEEHFGFEPDSDSDFDSEFELVPYLLDCCRLICPHSRSSLARLQAHFSAALSTTEFIADAAQLEAFCCSNSRQENSISPAGAPVADSA